MYYTGNVPETLKTQLQPFPENPDKNSEDRYQQSFLVIGQQPDPQHVKKAEQLNIRTYPVDLYTGWFHPEHPRGEHNPGRGYTTTDPAHLSEWQTVEWVETDPHARTQRIGGYPTPLYGEGITLVNEDNDGPLCFLGQAFLPDGRFIQAYTDADGALSGDSGDYEESYDSLGKDPYYQHLPSDAIYEQSDIIIVEGQNPPPWIILKKNEQQYIWNEKAYTTDRYPVRPSWTVFDDTPDDTPFFIFQIPTAVDNENSTIPSKDWTIHNAYIFWNGLNHCRIIWQWKKDLLWWTPEYKQLFSEE